MRRREKKNPLIDGGASIKERRDYKYSRNDALTFDDEKMDKYDELYPEESEAAERWERALTPLCRSVARRPDHTEHTVGPSTAGRSKKTLDLASRAVSMKYSAGASRGDIRSYVKEAMAHAHKLAETGSRSNFSFSKHQLRGLSKEIYPDEGDFKSSFLPTTVPQSQPQQSMAITGQTPLFRVRPSLSMSDLPWRDES